MGGLGCSSYTAYVIYVCMNNTDNMLTTNYNNEYVCICAILQLLVNEKLR